MRLEIVPVSIADARAFVDRVHRHHPAPLGGKFAVAVARGEEVVGVAIVGRPVARRNDDAWTAEVSRVAVLDDQPNACSKLYGACWRASRALGYRRLITYTLNSEPGTSLRAAGWRIIGQTSGKSWNQPSRPRIDRHPLQMRFKWAAPGSDTTPPPTGTA